MRDVRWGAVITAALFGAAFLIPILATLGVIR